jgi:hypothetical protein
LRKNCLVKRVIEDKIEVRTEVREVEEENVSSYWMISRKWEDTTN